MTLGGTAGKANQLVSRWYLMRIDRRRGYCLCFRLGGEKKSQWWYKALNDPARPNVILSRSLSQYFQKTIYSLLKILSDFSDSIDTE
jgi:hypothetical protein